MIVELKPPRADMLVPDELVGSQPSPSVSLVDRRSETRYTTNDPARIKLLEAGGGPFVDGMVLDVSRSGLKIETTVPIGKGLRLEIILPDRALIFGESRYCLRLSTRYRVGVAIEVVYYAQPVSGDHILDDQLRLYAVGKGLTALEGIFAKNHLLTCARCYERLRGVEIAQRPNSREQQARKAGE
jgi:hypothetical protein